MTCGVFFVWISNLFAIDGGLLPSAKVSDYFFFAIITAITLYLTMRLFGAFIVFFCAFWLIYFFVRGYMPEWTGILAGSGSTLEQSLRSMVLNFWSQTGGMFGQPIKLSLAMF